MVRYLPLLLVGICKTGSMLLLGMALDLSAPPLALLALALGTNFALTVSFFLVTGAGGPILISSMVCALFLVAIVMAWWRYGRENLPLRWLVFAPVYAIMKIPLYARFLFNRQREWVKGEREMRR